MLIKSIHCLNCLKKIICINLGRYKTDKEFQDFILSMCVARADGTVRYFTLQFGLRSASRLFMVWFEWAKNAVDFIANTQ